MRLTRRYVATEYAYDIQKIADLLDNAAHLYESPKSRH